MASLRGVSRSARSLPISQLSRQLYPTATTSTTTTCVRSASTSSSNESSSSSSSSHDAFAILRELETDSKLGTPQASPEVKASFRPWKRAADRKFGLPSSRYQYHPPKYNRGPLHPIQSPAASDPIARDYVPGPFNFPRLRQTYQSTVASDLMTIAYNHVPPGTPKKEPVDRLRGWDGSSPYHKNRAKRGPRGSPQLTVVEKDITFRNIPEIKEITIASYTPSALKDPDHLLVARTMLLAITGTTPEITKTHSDVAQWGIRSGERAGVKTTIYGNAAYEFLDRCIHLVFPRIKEWKGISASTGDSSGNLAFGLDAQDMTLFPEIEVNYDMYPSKMLTGCRVFVKTTATSDRQARLLLQSMGVPFYGQIRN
ncbi:ribosomal protein L5 domain-containing protein [Cercophora scortea]|uniref:Ribosomal protein L5 domain-containing protein n=1 Tax=Cercophora scortea TaxID=314031 RepID=A0AAE0INU6_9PEZI|nr:ribosomal protein L5 domain-containing protein [Cercophora scortea]